MYTQIENAETFTQRVQATHDFIQSLGDECSTNEKDGQLALDAIQQISELIRKDMDAIRNTMTSEEADAAVALFESLKKVIVREKKLAAARREFDAMAGGAVN
jgi:hypothetical protein